MASESVITIFQMTKHCFHYDTYAAKQEVTMSEQRISSKEQRCISKCIFNHWSENSKTPPEQRADAYEQCLSDCRICA